MKKSLVSVFLMALCMVFTGQTVCLADTPETLQSRMMDGRIISIDRDSREMTISDVSGNEITFLASGKICLDTLQEGDRVKVKYRIAVDAEVRRPTADEMKNPFEVLDQTMMEPESRVFPGTEVKVYKNVVTVKNIDRSLGMMSVREARGNLYTINVSKVSLLENVKQGDTMIITYTEPFVVSLKKRS